MIVKHLNFKKLSQFFFYLNNHFTPNPHYCLALLFHHSLLNPIAEGIDIVAISMSLFLC